MSSSYSFAKYVLDYIGAGASFATQPIYISLHTGSPGTTGANEVSNATYARVAAGAMNSVSTSISTNASAVTFAEGGDNESVSHAGAYYGSSAGTFLFGGALSSAFSYGAAVTPVFEAGNLKFLIS